MARSTMMTKSLWVELGFHFSPKTPRTAKDPDVWQKHDLWQHSVYQEVSFYADSPHEVVHVVAKLLAQAHYAGERSVQDPIRAALGIRT